MLLLLSPGTFGKYILSFLITNPKLVGFQQVCNIYKNKPLYLICMHIFYTYFDIYTCIYTYIYFFYIFLFSELFWRFWKRLYFINILLMHNSVWNIAGVWYPVIELKWILLKRRRENVLSHFLFPAVWGFEYELRTRISAFEPLAYQLYVPEPFNLSEF